MTAKQRTGAVLLVVAAILIVVPPIVFSVITSPETSPGTSTPEDLDRALVGFVVSSLVFFGLVLAVIGLILVTALMRREAHTASMLGHYVDGKWVCFEHAERWCPECTAAAKRQAREHEEVGAGKW